MPRFASVIKVAASDGSGEVDFSGCRGYLTDALQFLDDDYRETRITAADGTPTFQRVAMGSNPHRGNAYGFTLETVEASKVLALIALGKAMKAAGSFMRVSLTDALVTITTLPSKGDPDAEPFWVTTGRESEGMISDVNVRFIALQ